MDNKTRVEKIMIQADIARKSERERILTLLIDPNVGLMCTGKLCHACRNFLEKLNKGA